MKIRVRESKARDVGLFRKLWKGYLEETYNKGFLIPDTKQNLGVFEDLFDNYTAGRQEGKVFFVAEKGIIMFGAANSPFQTKYNKLAQIWGAYVEPDARKTGIGTALGKKVIEQMREMNFDGAVAGISFDLESSRLHSQLIDLKEDN